MMFPNLKLRAIPTLFYRPVTLLHNYQRSYIRSDLLAGLTVGVILLPQGMGFSLLAGLPPEMGLYSAIIAAIVAALWGSSNYLHTGPTNTASLLSFSVLVTVAMPGTADYLAAAGLLAILIGILRLIMGLLRLGMLVTFVSDSVIVGFTAGAGVLIGIGELRHLLRLDFPASPSLQVTIGNLINNATQTHWLSLAMGIGTILGIVILQKISRRFPGTLVMIGVASLLVWVFDLQQAGLRVLGELPQGLPPVAHLPLLDLELIGQLSTGALALAIIGLVEATAIARVFASQTGQRLDNNQEFVGQGLASIACGIFSGYPPSGSFNRSAVSYYMHAQTPLASVVSGVFVLLAMVFLAPLGIYVPRAALAGVLLLSAYGMVNWSEVRRIWYSARGDALIMLVTIGATLFFPLQFAILTGILMSLGYYILKTSTPRVHSVVPDNNFRHLVHQPEKPVCPQLGIIDILGDLYFGAVGHVEEAIYEHQARYPGQRFLLLRMQNVINCDISGIHTLEGIVRAYREQGGDIYITRVRSSVFQLMHATGFDRMLGTDHFLHEDTAIEYLFYKVLDPAICIYESNVRVFRECQNLPRPLQSLAIPLYTDIPTEQVPSITPHQLWHQLHQQPTPLVIDVREPREYKQGHIPQAHLLPLPRLWVDTPELPTERPVVFVCRGGRRSSRAAFLLQNKGYTNVMVLQGGMLAWEAADLITAVE